MRRSLLSALTGITLLAFTVSPASASPITPAPVRTLGHCLKHLPTHDKVVALTFDAGGGADGLHSILATLQKEAVTATFFVTGKWARTFPHRLRKIARLGHAVGNHSNTHPNMSHLDDAGFRHQVTNAERAIGRTTPSGPWFRFPFGLHTPHDIALLNDLGYACIQWTVDTAGWMGTSTGWSVDKAVERVLDGARRGEIVLMHAGANPNDGSTLDADALPTIIARLRDRGYRFVSLDSLLTPVT